MVASAWRGREDAPQARPQQAQERAVVALRRRMQPHSRRSHRDHEPPSYLRARRPTRVLRGSPRSTHPIYRSRKSPDVKASRRRPREATARRQAPPWAPAQLRRRMRHQTAPHPEALPNSAMVRPMIPTVFGDSFACSHLRTGALADGHPLAAEAHRNMLWTACENESLSGF